MPRRCQTRPKKILKCISYQRLYADTKHSTEARCRDTQTTWGGGGGCCCSTRRGHAVSSFSPLSTEQKSLRALRCIRLLLVAQFRLIYLCHKHIQRCTQYIHILHADFLSKRFECPLVDVEQLPPAVRRLLVQLVRASHGHRWRYLKKYGSSFFYFAKYPLVFFFFGWNSSLSLYSIDLSLSIPFSQNIMD